MNPKIAVPYSGGMDSYGTYMYLLESGDYARAEFFYFHHKLNLFHERKLAKERKGINLIDSSFDFRLLSRAPDPFIPFRNYFFAQYLIGLGFNIVMFSFTREDAVFSDTTQEFMDRMMKMAKETMGRDIVVTSPLLLKGFTRIDIVKKAKELDKEFGMSFDNGGILPGLLRTHSCHLYPACRSCMTCFSREIAFRYSGINQGVKDKDWTRHWKSEPSIGVVKDFFLGLMNGRYSLNVYERHVQYLESVGITKNLLEY